jgi:hypothetical protein
MSAMPWRRCRRRSGLVDTEFGSKRYDVTRNRRLLESTQGG